VTVNSMSLPDSSGARSSREAGQRVASLTARQVEILTWVQEGKSAWEIGKILNISGRSVDGHLRRIYAKLDVRTRLQAVLRAQDLGILARRPQRP
jgi:DNA-binding CsgD family transcriptional regulator